MRIHPSPRRGLPGSRHFSELCPGSRPASAALAAAALAGSSPRAAIGRPSAGLVAAGLARPPARVANRSAGITAIDEYPTTAIVALVGNAFGHNHHRITARMAPGILDRHKVERYRALEIQRELIAGRIRADLHWRALGAGQGPGAARGNAERVGIIVVKADAGAGRGIGKVLKNHAAGDGMRGGGGKGNGAAVVGKAAAIEGEVAADGYGTGTAGDRAARDGEVAGDGVAAAPGPAAV